MLRKRKKCNVPKSGKIPVKYGRVLDLLANQRLLQNGAGGGTRTHIKKDKGAVIIDALKMRLLFYLHF
jgi:hypothetical protein